MASASGANIAITGAGNATTGFATLASVDLQISAAATVNIRETSGAGTIIAQKVFAGAGTWERSWVHPLRCRSGVFFIENSAGNVTGGVGGW